MRKGYTFKKCKDCGRKVTDKACGCGSRRWSWAFRVDIAPKGATRRQVTRSGYGSQSEALAALADLQGDVEDGVRVDRHNLTVGDYLTRWVAGVNVKPSTKTGYEALIVNHLIPRLGDWRLQELDRQTIKKSYADMRANGAVRGGSLSQRTVHRAHTVLHRALSEAVKDKLIPFNPADEAHSEPKDTDEMRTWTADELGRFLNSQRDDRLYPLWRLAATTGMRRGELAGLKWDAVDLNAATVSVQRARVRTKGGVSEGTTKTGSGRRLVDIDHATVEALIELASDQMAEAAEWGDAYKHEGWVFCWEDGSPLEPTGISSRFKRRVEKARLPVIRFHDLRHTAATLQLQAGVPAHVVAQRLGHSTPAFTLQKYAHVLPGQQADAAAKVAALIDG